MKTARIDYSKIDQTALFHGKQGTYLNIVLHDKPTEYGDGFITQDLGQERRKAGERGPILGNWKNLAAPATAPKTTPPKQGEDFDNDDSIPY